MRHKRINCLLCCVLLMARFPAQAQEIKGIVFDNRVYDEAVAGLKVSVSGAHCAPLVISLDGNQCFHIVFDDLDARLRDLKYTLIHCDFKWEPTPDFPRSEYLSGFEEGYISDYAYSMNTAQHYLTYRFSLPNEDMQWRKSGNYLLCVYEDEDHPLFTYRLMVAEEKVSILPEFQASTNIPEHLTHQEARFQVKPKGIRLLNPSQTVKVLLMQNQRADNALLLSKPYAQQGDVLLYDKPGAITMPGGSEFHRFNMRSMVRTLENVRQIHRTEDSYHVYVYPDPDRSRLPYVSETDVNGCCLLLSDTEALASDLDYARVHFEWRYDRPLDGEVYVFGELTHWRFLEEAKMQYRPDLHAYTASLYLKAGYYNYTYVFVPRNSAFASFFADGSHWETENSYTFLVYYHPDGTDYDRLIGYKQTFFKP